MKDELVKYETAVLAKEKGFIVLCKMFYDPNISAPEQSLLQRWLREVHNIHIYVEPLFSDTGELKYAATIAYEDGGFNTGFEEDDLFETYEAALEDGLVESLKIIT